jgi:alpha-L-fucosidase
MIVFNSFFILISFFLFIIKDTYAATPKKNKSCEKVIETLEDHTDIPKNLLLSIGKSESGRILKNNKHVIWPWTVNHAGKSLFFDTKKQMKKYVLKNVEKKDFNLDVGCMQINLKWHKNNFKKISDMLAIEPNVSYAASFLLQLKNKHGSWNKAIKHYHSSDPNKNKPYLIKVNKFWKNQNNISIKLAANNKEKKSNTNSLSSMIKDSQPYLFARIEKVKFFRNIFSQN